MGGEDRRQLWRPGSRWDTDAIDDITDDIKNSVVYIDEEGIVAAL